MMSIRIDQEGPVIVRCILGPIPRRTIVAPAMGEADRVKASDRLRIGSAKAHMKPAARSDRPRLVVRRVHYEELGRRGAVADEIGSLEAPCRADGCQQRVVEGTRARQIRNTNGKMIYERHRKLYAFTCGRLTGELGHLTACLAAHGPAACGWRRRAGC